MRISNFTSVRPTMSDTRTFEDFSKFLGAKPERLGVVARLYPHLTASYLTDALRNVFYVDSSKTPKYQSINSFCFEWNVETNYIKRIELADTPSQSYAGGEITMAFKERYFEQNDIFRNDITEEQFFVVSGPTRKADNYWELQVRPVDSVIESDKLDLTGAGWNIGDTCRFIGNAFKNSDKILLLFLVDALLGD